MRSSTDGRRPILGRNPPRRFHLVALSSGVVAGRVLLVEDWLAKGIGVLGRRALPVGEGIWMPGVASVHTCFVAFPLDILFLGRDFEVLAVHPNMPPWRLLVRCPNAAHTIELGAGTLSRSPMAPGDQTLLEKC